ncbi:hypothetical protein MKW92_018060, partial [Papaver armeniacum]
DSGGGGGRFNRSQSGGDYGGVGRGVKINNLDMVDARGFDRSRISSRSIEAYLIQ